MDNMPDKRVARVETLSERLFDKENLVVNQKAEKITICGKDND